MKHCVQLLYRISEVTIRVPPLHDKGAFGRHTQMAAERASDGLRGDAGAGAGLAVSRPMG
jgi:hypothetical protein